MGTGSIVGFLASGMRPIERSSVAPRRGACISGAKEYRMKYCCHACNRSLAKVQRAPMLHNEVWRRITKPGEHLLCEQCARQRAKDHLSRDLTMADLRPCAFNMHRSPPWFAVLTQGRMTPELDAQWSAVIAEAKAAQSATGNSGFVSGAGG